MSAARRPEHHPYVGRGALKLRHALEAFSIDPAGLRCADLGCHVGGFTDCLLRAGAGHVVAVDTAYGTLDYTLRSDERVTVRERTNVLHAEPEDAQHADLVVIDLGWTPQRRCLPAALRWLRGPDARIITLVKPHYEASDRGEGHLLVKGVLDETEAERISGETIDGLPALGVRVLGRTRSPISGGRGRGNASGNTEFFALLAPAGACGGAEGDGAVRRGRS